MKLAIALTSSLVAFAASAVELTVNCANPGGWKIRTDCVSAADGVEIHRIAMTSPTNAVPPKFTVSFGVPGGGFAYRWCGEDGRVALPPEWWSDHTSDLAHNHPYVAYVGMDDANRFALTYSETLRGVHVRSGIREADASITAALDYFGTSEAPRKSYETFLRLDSRRKPFHEVAADAMTWLATFPENRPCATPEAAFDPLYSSWYAFHHDVSEEKIISELREAAKDGMKVVIVDDGWQALGNLGYRGSGDWDVDTAKFPDLKRHVDEAHKLGLKYMLWVSAPFCGHATKAYQRFKGKFLCERSHFGDVAIFDPRFPDVRAYLVERFTHLVRDNGLDGLKIDFIDCFLTYGKADPAVAENYAGRDLKTVPEAIDRLLVEAKAKIEEICPGALIEFRQQYVGPAIRKYGNMLRAADSPADAIENRRRTVALRILSGETAVHADMLEWSPRDTPEEAARQILAVLFSTIQYSMRLKDLSPEHREMARHWIAFTQRHREALLKGKLTPHRPMDGFPLVEGESANDRVIAVYQPGLVVPVAGTKPTTVVNATGAHGLVVRAVEPPRSVKVFDTYGKLVSSAAAYGGLFDIPVPDSGFAELSWEEPAHASPRIYRTTADRPFREVEGAVATGHTGPGARLIDLDAAKGRHDFLGLGVSFNEAGCHLLMKMRPEERRKALELVFGRTGANLSVGRIHLGSSDYSRHLYSYDDHPGDEKLEKFSIADDLPEVIPVIKEALAVNPSLYLFASPWSPPGWMKDNGSLCGGSLRPEMEGVYADYFVKFFKAYREQGLEVKAYTVQNEPETEQDSNSPTCAMDVEQEVRMIKAIGSRAAAAGLDVRAWLYDHNYNGTNRVLRCLRDAGLMKNVGGVAWHPYEGKPEWIAPLKAEFPDVRMMVTEVGPNVGQKERPAYWGAAVLRAINAGCSGFTGWCVALNEEGQPNVSLGFPCAGLIEIHSETQAVTPSGQLEFFRHLGPFVRRGAKVLDAPLVLGPKLKNRETRGLVHTAFRNPDGSHVVVFVHNTKGSYYPPPKIQVQIKLDGKYLPVQIFRDAVTTVVLQ